MGNGVAAELAREARRTSVRWLLAGALLLLVAWALFALAGLVEAFVTFAFVFAPLAMLPFGAELGARDRAVGMAKIQATMPISTSAVLLAKIGVLLAILAAYLAGALAAGTALLWPTIADPTTHLLGALAWGALVGTSAGILGLVIGLVASGRRSAAVGAGSLVAIVSGLLGGNASDLLELAGGGAAGTVLEVALELSPITWFELSSSSAIVPVVPPVGAVVAVVGSTLALVAILFLVASAQAPTGWPAEVRIGRLVLVGLVLLAAAAIPAVAAEPSVPEDQPDLRQEATVGAYEVHFRDGGLEAPAVLGGEIEKGITVTGPINQTVDLRIADVTSPTLTIEDIRPRSRTLVLDGRTLDNEAGRAGVQLQLTYRIEEPERAHRLELDLRIDDEPLQLSTRAFFVDWEVSMLGASTASVVSASLPLVAGAVFARRWDTWT